jgi:hypothetical protein
MSATGFWIATVVTMIIFVIAQIRNISVFKVRITFCDDPALYPVMYRRLPDYGDMLYSPRYWGLWTKSQWINWLSREA